MEQHSRRLSGTGPPIVSVLMASFRAGPYIGQALRSVLNQSVRDLEVIVVDDGSDDESIATIESAMAGDPRVRLLRTGGNRGPAHARNRALEVATGTWLAVVDADDIIHPERFERLVAAANELDADVVADNLMQFYEDGSLVAFLLPSESGRPVPISPLDWILAGTRPDLPVLGYLKPMVRARRMQELRYDETLRIGEDFDLMLRLLLSGASAWVIPEPWYFYRKHSHSVSHRLSVADVAATIASQERLMREAPPASAVARHALEKRLRHLRAGLQFERLVQAIKGGDAMLAAGITARDPGQVLRLGRAIATGWLRRRRGRPVLSPRPEEQRPLRLHLTDRAPGDFRDGVEVIQVPPFVAPGLPTGGWRHRQVWADIANRSNAAPVEVHWDGEAGRYAAGFAVGSVAPVARALSAEVAQ